MPVLFWVCREEEEEHWLVMVEAKSTGSMSTKKWRFSTL